MIWWVFVSKGPVLHGKVGDEDIGWHREAGTPGGAVCEPSEVSGKVCGSSD